MPLKIEFVLERCIDNIEPSANASQKLKWDDRMIQKYHHEIEKELNNFEGTLSLNDIDRIILENDIFLENLSLILNVTEQEM